MLAYVRGDIIVATHDDAQNIDPEVYGDDVFVVPFPDSTTFERVGDPPPAGEYDTRPQKIPEPDPAALKLYAAYKRWHTESTGTFNQAGVAVRTDAVTRSKINLAYLATQKDKNLVLDWKKQDGTFAALDMADVDTMMASMSAFIEKAFSQEKQALAAIEAGAATTYADVDTFFADTVFAAILNPQ